MNLTGEIQLCNLLPFCYDRQNHFDRSVAQAVHSDTAKQVPLICKAQVIIKGEKLHNWRVDYCQFKTNDWKIGTENQKFDVYKSLKQKPNTWELDIPRLAKYNIIYRISSYSCRQLFFFEIVNFWKIHIVSASVFLIYNENLNSFLTRVRKLFKGGNYMRK